MTRRLIACFAGVGAILVAVAPVAARPSDDPRTALPMVTAIAPAQARVELTAGWSSIDATPHADAGAELVVARDLSITASATLTDTGDDARPGVGVAWQIRRDDRDRVALRAALRFRAEGMTEPEGELEASVTAARGGVVGAVTYGQDPEGNERDAEVALGVARARGALTIGAVTRGRRALGDRLEHGRRWDAIALGVAAIQTGDVRVSASAGPELVAAQVTTVGVVALLGVAAAW